MNVIVLAGGLSPERDVSLSSGAEICKTLRKSGHHAYLLDVFMGIQTPAEELPELFASESAGLEIAAGIKASEPDLKAIKASRADQSDSLIGPNVIELCRLADIVFMALHGDIGENGKLQATFDVLGIRYTGPNYLGSALAMNKTVTKHIFQKTGIPTPGGLGLLKKDADASLERLGLTLPLVIKPCSGGSSIGVYIVHTEAEYRTALDSAFRLEDELIIEPYIKGREFSVGIIRDRVLPVIEIVPKSGFFDYKNKYQDGMTEEICPARLDADIARKMQEITVRAFEVLKLDVYSRADFILTDNGDIYCLEINSLPGMTPASLLPREATAAGIQYEDLCELIITESLRKYTSKGLELK